MGAHHVISHRLALDEELARIGFREVDLVASLGASDVQALGPDHERRPRRIHVPVNADEPHVEAILVDEHDPHVNALMTEVLQLRWSIRVARHC
ncbi:hypothetical protein AB6806_21010 [Bosea sp. RCC_152_1]|uniref:hypothetical protein n=1 Tax=Bosea sp. RCC_152_1 TaxID=3239228 RepID=UPI0035256A2B